MLHRITVLRMDGKEQVHVLDCLSKIVHISHLSSNYCNDILSLTTQQGGNAYQIENTKEMSIIKIKHSLKHVGLHL